MLGVVAKSLVDVVSPGVEAGLTVQVRDRIGGAKVRTVE